MTPHHVLDQRPFVPVLGLELSDGDRAVGWIRGRTLGFRGFAHESDAGAAAAVAYQTAAHRLGRGTGAGPMTADVQSLALKRLDGREVILASGQEIGTLLPPEAGSRSGSDSFGFEIEIPAPADDLRMRSMAHLIYRTLRRSGVRWSAPVPEVKQAKPSIRLARRHRASPALTRGGIPMYQPNLYRPAWMYDPIQVQASLPPPASAPSATRFAAAFLMTGMAIVAALALVLTAPLKVLVPLGFVFFAGLSATLALSALDRRRQRRERRGRESSGASRSRSPVPQHPDSSSRSPSVSGALAAFSLMLLGIAFIAPQQLAVGLAAMGLAGLFVLRVFAMYAGWSPRGSVWAEPRSAGRARAT